MAESNATIVERLCQAIATLEAQQRELGIDHSQQLAVLHQRLLEAGGLQVSGPGAIATNGGLAGGAGSAVIGGDMAGNVIVAGNGATISIGDQPIRMTAVQRESALGRYLSHIISRTRYLQLQEIRSGGRLVNIELEHIYVTL